MKRNVRKKILLLTVCTMIVGALLLTGCRPKNEIDDPWLDTWQAVVVDRSVEVEKVEVSARHNMFSSQFKPLPQVAENRDDIDGLLNAIFAPVASFEPASDDAISTRSAYYQLDFCLAGTGETFSVRVKSSEYGTIYHSLGDTGYLLCDKVKDYDAFENIANRILGIDHLD